MRRLVIAATLLVLTPLLAAAAQSPLDAARQDFQAGRFAHAATTLQQAAQTDADNAELYYWLGRCFYELRNYQKASDEAQKAVKLDANNSDYHLWLARSYGRLAEAHHSLWLGIRTRKEFEAAVKADPKNIAARRDLMEFYASAPWIVGGSKKKAKEQIAAVAALDAVQGTLAQAEYDRITDDTDGAQQEYEKVFDEKPTDPTEYYEVADFYAGQQNAAQLQRAIDGVLGIAPDDSRLGYYRGVLLAIDGQQLDEAETYLKAYLATTVNRTDYPSHADARTWLGHVYEKLGRRLEAAEQYRAALEIDPDSGFAKRSLKNLEQQVN